ncbi:MAG: hypothetical protein RLZZ58_1373 [Pseudomonadota bacterium]
MPTVLRIGGFRFHFFSHEPGEPPHIHIDCAGTDCKTWLDPVSVARNRGMSPRDLGRALTLVRENRILLQEAWHGYFGINR